MTETSQRWDPERYARTARFVAEYGASVLERLDPKPGERILDLGCGDGALTVEIANAGATVVGVDASAEQVAATRALGVDAQVMSGDALTFDSEFDAVFTNAALHWIKDAPAVIAGVRRALKPEGRFVGEMGGAGNVAAVRGALHEAVAGQGIDPLTLDPWYFPDETEYGGLLEAGGFDVLAIERFSRPTPIPGPLEDWLDTFGESFLKALPKAERGPTKAAIAAGLRPMLCGDDGKWTVDYVRLRFEARLRR
ncbi:MAG: methyltransferase domain-containing protein [Alphaproteobacteria bacterium]|nr:methyltransferase domain-containing protein [Alphaproteobacteria bacterium]